MGKYIDYEIDLGGRTLKHQTLHSREWVESFCKAHGYRLVSYNGRPVTQKNFLSWC